MQRLRRPHSKGDGPPVFSHEFVIQNHADIISCVCMVIFMGLIPQITHALASSIIFVQYNVTVEPKDPEGLGSSARTDLKPLPETMYQHGWKDLVNVVFYCMVWIIIHALIQEYIWERTVKRLRLSKVKTGKYYDSGCLVVFYLMCLIWGVDFVIKEGYLWNWSLLWEDYPHTLMRLSLKFFMLNQMAFWLHCYPELYFMKAKKDEMYSKLVLYTSSLLIIGGAYFMRLQQLAVLLVILHYSVEFLFHASRLLHYHGKDDIAITGFKVWQVLFVLVRVVTVFVSVLTMWYGLGKVHDKLVTQLQGMEDLPPPPEEPGDNETTPTLAATPTAAEIATYVQFTDWMYRLAGLVFLLALQLWVGWTFLSYQLERTAADKTKSPEPAVKKPGKKSDSKKPDGKKAASKKNNKTSKEKTS